MSDARNNFDSVAHCDLVVWCGPAGHYARKQLLDDQPHFSLELELTREFAPRWVCDKAVKMCLGCIDLGRSCRFVVELAVVSAFALAKQEVERAVCGKVVVR